MPYIGIQVNHSLDTQQERAIQAKLEEAITLLPGKSSRWLMTSFKGDVHFYFQGDGNTPAAFVDVRIFGGSDRASYEQLTAALTSILTKELGTPSDRIYVVYGETENWGWNGSNL
ncbi:MAG: hypothetical protein HFH02_07025 [Dorea sp.]|nr:hypothetical protein [Dorea sp.]